MDALDAIDTYLHLGTGPELTQIPVTPEFWPTLDAHPELLTGRLVTGYGMNADWESWEQHPAGDEVVVVTTGTVRFHVELDGETHQVTVEAPRYIVVPAGAWHTADYVEPATLLVITWGAGTTHRPRT